MDKKIDIKSDDIKDAGKVEKLEEGVDQKKIKYPKAVFFIITNEFCERFCYYGMKTVLFLYMLKKLKYEKTNATVLFHSWAGLCYFFPIFGGIIADTFLGKFKTIVYLSVIYFLGNVLLSVASITRLHLPQRELSLLGLFLIAIGTGGIKPCVSSFGGDQFVLPQQQGHLDKFFSFFYFAINAGSLISTFITPIFREDLQCFGEDTCFPVAFGVPAALMFVAIVIFLAGRPLYKISKPKGNIAMSVCQCIWRALRNKYKTTKSNRTKLHWLDYADDRYSEKIINDIKILLRVLVLFVPLPVFWALFDQQGSKWTSQADQTSGDIGTSFTIKPDQMQVVNPFLILAMIPLFQYVVYPIIARCGINTPLRKLTTGGLLAALAFLMSAMLQFQIQGTRKIQTLRVYNGLDCGFTYNSPLQDGTLDPMGMISFSPAGVTEDILVTFSPLASCNVVKESYTAKLTRAKDQGTSYLFLRDESTGLGSITKMGVKDDISTSSAEPNKLRILYNSELKGKNITLLSSLGYSRIITLPADRLYSDYIGGQPSGIYSITNNQMVLATDVSMKRGGVYVLNVECSSNQCKSNVVQAAYSWVHMLWLLPQYITISAAEVMFSVSGLEFAFTQAPLSMKSVLSACWLLTVAFGNLIVVFVAGAEFFPNPAHEFLLFAGLMVLDMFGFMLLAMRYQYVTYNTEEGDEDNMPYQSTSTQEN